MKHIYCYFRLIFLFTIFPAMLLSQNLDWQQNYSSVGDEYFRTMEPTSDDGYIADGFTDSGSHVRVTDIYGEVDYHTSVDASKSSISIPLNEEDGVYFITLDQQEKTNTYKVIKR